MLSMTKQCTLKQSALIRSLNFLITFETIKTLQNLTLLLSKFNYNFF